LAKVWVTDVDFGLTEEQAAMIVETRRRRGLAFAGIKGPSFMPALITFISSTSG
jgi:hypothetical protein